MSVTKTENCAVKFSFQYNSSRGENTVPLAVDVIVGYQVYMTSGSRWYARVRGQDSCLQFRVIRLNIKYRVKAYSLCQIFNSFNLFILHTRVNEMETPAHFPVQHSKRINSLEYHVQNRSILFSPPGAI
jgi:hypothetical protein